MLISKQIGELWDAIRALPSGDRQYLVRHAFDLVLLNLDEESGEVLLTREEIAAKIGCGGEHVSRIMGTLERMGIIRRERRRIPGVMGPGRAVYFIDPQVGRALGVGTLEPTSSPTVSDDPVLATTSALVGSDRGTCSPACTDPRRDPGSPRPLGEPL